MKYFNLLVFSLLFGCCISANAQNCDKPKDPESSRVYFVNGMNSEFFSSSSAKNPLVSSKLLQVLMGSGIVVGNSFNFRETAFVQLKQVAVQKGIEPVLFWELLDESDKYNGNEVLPISIGQFFEAYHSLLAQYTRANLVNDVDLQVMINQYLLDLRSGKKVILVGHSQGNFYANQAYAFIKAAYPQYANSIGIVMIGTPSSVNLSTGPHTNNTLDEVIKYFPTLPLNVTDPRPAVERENIDKKGHSFNLTYLPVWGESRIKSHILTMINQLQKPVKHIECASPEEVPVQVATWAATDVTTTSGKMKAYLTSGKNVFVWFKWAVETTNVGSCASKHSVYPGGTGQPGEYYANVTGRSPSQTVYYRACAIGPGNQISEGQVMSFKTLRSCNSEHTFTGAYSGIDIWLDMGFVAGTVQVEFKAYDIADRLWLRTSSGITKVDTGWVTNVRNQTYYSAGTSDYALMKLTVNGGATGTVWKVRVSCPGEFLPYEPASSSNFEVIGNVPKL